MNETDHAQIVKVIIYDLHEENFILNATRKKMWNDRYFWVWENCTEIGFENHFEKLGQLLSVACDSNRKLLPGKHVEALVINLDDENDDSNVGLRDSDCDYT